MKKFGKILTVLLIFIFIMSFVACGNTSTTDPTGTGTDAEQPSEIETLLTNSLNNLVSSNSYKITGTVDSAIDNNDTDVFEAQENAQVAIDATFVREDRNAGVKMVGGITKDGTTKSTYGIYFPNDDNTFYFNTKLLGINIPIAFDITMPQAIGNYIGTSQETAGVLAIGSLINVNELTKHFETVAPSLKTFINTGILKTIGTGKSLTYTVDAETFSTILGVDLTEILEGSSVTVEILFNASNNICGVNVSGQTQSSVLGVINNSETETSLPEATKTETFSIKLALNTSSGNEFAVPENFNKNDYVKVSTNIKNTETFDLFGAFINTLTQENYNVKMNLSAVNPWSLGGATLEDGSAFGVNLQCDSTFFGDASYKQMTVLLPSELGGLAGGDNIYTATYNDGKGTKYVKKESSLSGQVTVNSNTKQSSDAYVAPNPMSSMISLISILFPSIFGGTPQLKGGACLNDCISIDVVNTNGIYRDYEVSIDMEGLIDIYDYESKIEIPNAFDTLKAAISTKDGIITKISIKDFKLTRYDFTVVNGIFDTQKAQTDPLTLNLDAVFSPVTSLEAPKFTAESTFLTSDVAVKKVMIGEHEATFNAETGKYEVTVDSNEFNAKFSIVPRDQNAYIPAPSIFGSPTYIVDGELVLESNFAIAAGTHEITGNFTASDGATPGTVTVCITRPAYSEPTLNKIKVNNNAVTFDENKSASFDYNDKALSFDELSIYVSTLNNSSSTITQNGEQVTGNTFTLINGVNKFEIEVTAEDGKKAETYTVNVNYNPVYSSASINGIEATFSDNASTLDLESKNLVENKLPIKVTAYDGWTYSLIGADQQPITGDAVLSEGENTFTLKFTNNSDTTKTVEFTLTVNYTISAEVTA